MINVLIIKPTKMCNADCIYCAAPPEVNGGEKWTIDDFKTIFDNLENSLSPTADFIWHGGEPMLMGPDFYVQAYEYATSKMPNINFSMQSNILGYDHKRWYDVLTNIMKRKLSTSFDPDEQFRTYKGDSSLYSRIFYDRLDKVLEDGFRPTVIGTYSEETIHMADIMYDKALAGGDDKWFNIRFNYRYPAGRDSGKGEAISPKTYGEALIRLYDRWIKDVPPFTITPLDQMMKKILMLEDSRCPWTNRCGGAFFGIEPNGNVYNCGEFADLDDDQYKFGNIFHQTGLDLLKSRAARNIRRRRVVLPEDCKTCRHFAQCEGGCMRDSVLYGKGLGGKFHYCYSWKMVFDRIKDSIKSGEADRALEMYKMTPDLVRQNIDLNTPNTFKIPQLRNKVIV